LVRGTGCGVLGPMELGLIDFFEVLAFELHVFDVVMINYLFDKVKFDVLKHSLFLTKKNSTLWWSTLFDKVKLDVVLITSFWQSKIGRCSNNLFLTKKISTFWSSLYFWQRKFRRSEVFSIFECEMFAQFWVSWDEEDGFISPLLTNKRCKKISNLNNNRKISWKLVVIFISLAG